jgi:hypothetical protein
MTRAIEEYEFQNALDQSQQLIDEEIERFINLDKLLLKSDFNNLANAIFGTLSMVYLCRYCLKVFEIMSMNESSPDLFFRIRKIEELSHKFDNRYVKAVDLYKKYTPSEIGQDLSSEKLEAIYLQASERFGSRKFNMDIDN